MSSDYKILLRDIVELFYQPTFKIFNINSIDGETLIKPVGYFISLGITTSLKVMLELKNIFNNSDYGFNANLVEISSTWSKSYNDYLNVVLCTPESEITKYNSEVPGNCKIYGKEESEKMISELQKNIDSGDYSKVPVKQKIQELTEKIVTYEGSWDNHGILEKHDGSYTIFHRNINYKKTDNIEYRIGIYVVKN